MKRAPKVLSLRNRYLPQYVAFAVQQVFLARKLELFQMREFIKKVFLWTLRDMWYPLVVNHCLSKEAKNSGGLRANWFEVSSNRYKAIISYEGWADELDDALKSPPLQRIYDERGGSPQKVPENYIKNSPSYFVQNATTPILFLMGNSQLGSADPFNSVLKFHKEIRKKGIETNYIKYADEGHILEE